jgi:hypothetical protein
MVSQNDSLLIEFLFITIKAVNENQSFTIPEEVPCCLSNPRYSEASLCENE